MTIGKTVNVDELARHMSEHNTPYSKGAIKGVLTKAGTGEFTRAELTKAGNVTELPKNFTDYQEEDDEPQNQSGGSGSSQDEGGNSDAPPVINPDTDHPSDGD